LNDDKVDIKALVTQHLSKEGAGQWLLIFDDTNNMNLRSTGLPAGQAANLVDYLPQSELCSIIFTTTSRDTAERLALQNVVVLGKMAPATAQSMLENYLSTRDPRNEREEAKLLLKELSYIPLAIVQAAAYINTRDITLQKYRSQLVKQEEEAPERNSAPSEGAPHEYGTKHPVATTLLISVDQIRRSSSLAAKLAANYIFLAASVDRKDIPLDLLEAASPREKEDAIKVLSSYKLVTRRPAESALDLHQLVHHALREWLEKQQSLGQWTRNAIRQLVRIFPESHHGNRSK
jgi:hypothetical protein